MTGLKRGTNSSPKRQDEKNAGDQAQLVQLVKLATALSWAARIRDAQQARARRSARHDLRREIYELVHRLDGSLRARAAEKRRRRRRNAIILVAVSGGAAAAAVAAKTVYGGR